jgi:anti-sigma factor RsiW
MKCADIEVLLSDYIDGTLGAVERASVESHLSGCGGCAEMLRDIQGAIAFVERAEKPEPPQELITRILFHTPMSGEPARAARRGKSAAGWLRGWFTPLLQPRFAMGMAMTILSFSMVSRVIEIPQRQLTMADLEPARVWAAVDDKVHRAWSRAVKYYENLRLVYEIQGRLQQWTVQEEEERKAQSGGHIEPKSVPAPKSPGADPDKSAPESKTERRTQPGTGEGSKNK